jgi:hypothetical protein
MWEYVEDDRQGADAALARPSAPAYPQRSDYNAYGRRAYDEYTRALNNYNARLNAYYGNLEIYRQKEWRDTLRNILNEPMPANSYERLHYYDGKETVAFSDGWQRTLPYGGAGLFVYERPQLADISTKIKLSAIDSLDRAAIQAKIRAASGQAPLFSIAGRGHSTPMEYYAGYYLEFSADGKKIWFKSNQAIDPGDLYELATVNGVPGKTALYDTDVTWIFSGSPRKKAGGVLYFKGNRNQNGDLYLNKKNIDTDVRFYQITLIENDLSQFLYFTDWNENRQSGTLKFYNNGKITKIADDVNSVQAISDKFIAYLADYDANRVRGDVYLYTGEEARQKIDIDASGFVNFLEKYRSPASHQVRDPITSRGR